MCFVIWKYMCKYVWVKKYVKIYVILFKNWKHVFELQYQTGQGVYKLKCVYSRNGDLFIKNK